jgi:hypothetical protein
MRTAKVAGGVKLHLYFAAVNVAGALTMGVLLGFDKVRPFLPGYVLANVFAHAHLAAIGWVCMTVLGFGYRLLPMVLPAAMPSGRSLYGSAVVLEAGVAGLFVSLVTRSATLLFVVLILAAFGVFAFQILWMLARPRRPAHRRSPDFALHHLCAAGVCLVLAGMCGVTLAASPMTDATMRLALVYGVLGLVGFLAQTVVGFERRLLPIACAYWALEKNGVPGSASPPPAAPVATFVAWLSGVPLLAIGFLANLPPVLAAGGWLLFAASLLMFLDVVRMFSPPAR